MIGVSTWTVLCFVSGVLAARDVDFANPAWKITPDNCDPGPEGRVPWILHVREPDYGWKQHTHRANIALAVNKYHGSDEEMRKMELQLEVEITKALFRNVSSSIHENDLALFIHALLATGKNPRDFHGNDLVADLLHRVNSNNGNVHPFLMLALCNSHAITFDHLRRIVPYAEHNHDNDEDVLDARQAELKALTLKTFACAISLDKNNDKFRKPMEKAANCLRRRQSLIDGSFGNVYTTSLAVQALTACNGSYAWDEEKALVFLEKESTVNVNMIKAYYIENALNAHKVKFIKDLYPGIPHAPVVSEAPNYNYVTYTIKNVEKPKYYFTVTMEVDPQWNFFHIMEKAAQLSDRFTFKSALNSENLPMVYALSGTPNDPEENMFWRICRQSEVDHDRHVSTVSNFHDSPAKLVPRKDEHIVFWYRDSECIPK